MARPGMKSKGAIEVLEERLSRDPLSRAFLQLAEEYRKSGRYDDAVRVCMEGLARHPTYHTARIALGRTYLEAGDLEGARRALSEVLELAPENHLAAKLLAEVQRRLGDAKGAIATYRAILTHYPADREIEALLRDLEASPAPPAVETAVAKPAAPRPDVVAPRPVPEAPRLGLTAPPAALKEPSFEYRPEDLEAASRPEEVRSVREPDVLQTNTLAELYLRQGMVDKAIQVYRQMLRVDPRNDRARLRLRELSPELNTPPVPAEATAPALNRRMPGNEPAPRPLAHSPAPVLTSPVAAESHSGPGRRAIGRLERWLRTVQTHAAPVGGAASR